MNTKNICLTSLEMISLPSLAPKPLGWEGPGDEARELLVRLGEMV